MSGPSSTPRGEHAGRPGTHWNTALVLTGEQLVDDDVPTPRPNRATRRAAKRAGHPPFSKEQHMATDEADYGTDDCTCIPFTRQTNPPRILNQPTDTVDMISGWQRGADCPHHRPMAVTPARPRTFGLIRQHDVTGVSGTGRVADGTLWPDGTVSIRWRGDRPSIVHWAELADVEHVHGHGGHTRIAWDDEQHPADPAAAHAVVDTVTREQLHAAIRTLAQRDPQWWHAELNRLARIEGHTSVLGARR